MQKGSRAGITWTALSRTRHEHPADHGEHGDPMATIATIASKHQPSSAAAQANAAAMQLLVDDLRATAAVLALGGSDAARS
jgi:hypothetical protein